MVVNTSIFTQPELLKQLAQEFGQQCLVGSLDLKRVQGKKYKILIESGMHALDGFATEKLKYLSDNQVGEWYVNSVDNDGTGQGYDLALLDQMPIDWSVPIILAGGAGNASHLATGLKDSRVDAVATAHLFNFVGDGLKQARASLSLSGIELAKWPEIDKLTGKPNFVMVKYVKVNRILIVGLGSIGRRHLRLARELLPYSKIAVLRHKLNLLSQKVQTIFFLL